jgi:hypothetical protein
LTIRNRIEDFFLKKKHREGWEWREESKGEKRKVCRKIRETPIFLCKTKWPYSCLSFQYAYDFTLV